MAERHPQRSERLSRVNSNYPIIFVLNDRAGSYANAEHRMPMPWTPSE